MEGPGEELGITYQDLLHYFETHGDSAEMRRESTQDQDLEVSGGGRWKPFENFHRAVGDEAVMTSEEGILRDYLPGTELYQPGTSLATILYLILSCTSGCIKPINVLSSPSPSPLRNRMYVQVRTKPSLKIPLSSKPAPA